jgi:hypothetical protein
MGEQQLESYRIYYKSLVSAGNFVRVKETALVQPLGRLGFTGTSRYMSSPAHAALNQQALQGCGSVDSMLASSMITHWRNRNVRRRVRISRSIVHAAAIREYRLAALHRRRVRARRPLVPRAHAYACTRARETWSVVSAISIYIERTNLVYAW